MKAILTIGMVICLLAGHISAQPTAADSIAVADTLLPATADPGSNTATPEVYVRELQPAAPMEEILTEQEWLAVIVFVFWGLFAFLRIYNFNLFQYRWRAFLNFNIATQYFRDEGVFSSFLHALYHVHYLLGLSLLNVLVLPYLVPGIEPRSIQVWLVVFVALLGLYVVRLLFSLLLSEVFQLGEVLRFAQFYSNLTYSHLAYLMMPVATVGLLTSVPKIPLVAVWAAIIALIAAIGIRYIRGLQVVAQYFGLFQLRLIAYICTVEIAPVVILLKTAQQLLFNQG